MATINPTVKRAPQGAGSIITSSWVLGNADTGVQIDLTDYADRSVQVEGTFGSATITIQGSNDGTNWQTVRGPDSVALTFTASGLKQVLETTLYLRVISAGGTGTSVTVTLVGRKILPLAWS
jgi:hypothetical protein